MASPITTGGPRMPTPLNQQQSAMAISNETEEPGLQVRPMGLKVHYTFDKDSCVNCLARWPQILNVQAMPIDESNWIGIVDLRICVQAIAQGSPELLSRNENDYAIYAFDYSEPDTPLVGQGMLSWALDPSTASGTAPMEDYGSKMVTGRVTKNMLALFGNGVRETLEVKLKLTEVARMMRLDCTGGSMDTTSNYARQAPTPTDTTEWNSFLQANPNLGRSVSVSAMPSPSLAPARPYMSAFQVNPANEASCSFDANRPISGPISRPGSRPGSRQSSAPPYQNARAPPPLMPARLSPAAFATASPPPAPAAHNDPVSASTPPAKVTARPARPSRRSRSRVPTGRPRGRPRKAQVMDGNTSAAEEVQTDADADDTHKKKRAKTTKADYPMHTSLDAPPESLRVHASTSGSLRTLRPVSIAPVPGSESNPAPNSHLQELPRAPTPIPQGGGPPSQYHARKMLAQKARRESLVDYDSRNFQDHMYARSVDARSPTDSMAPSPENFTPEDSPADMGSSPPVPRSATYVPQSSPMPSSPILPPMPRQQPDSGFMSGGVDDLFEDYDCTNDAMRPPPSFQGPAAPAPTLPHSQSRPTDAPVGVPPATSSTAPSIPCNLPSSRKSNARPMEQFEFLPMNPGPPELLPVTSIYNPPPPPKSRSSKLQGATTGGVKLLAPAPHRSYSEPAQLEPQQQLQSTRQSLASTSETDDVMSTRASAPAELPAPTDTQPLNFELPMPNIASALPVNVDKEAEELEKLIEASNECDHATLSSRSFSGTGFPSEMSGQESAAQVHGQQQQPTLPQQPAEAVSRATGSDLVAACKILSRGNEVLASDPPALPPLTLPSAPPAPSSFSEALCPASDAEPLTKNLVRKAAIRERLQKAIESGEMPPFCQNCGAIETPTWRKMWTQDHQGEPRYNEFSELPGSVTAIDILEKDEEGKTTRYRLVKKTLGPAEDNKLWTQMLLCNPCGIWLGKFKKHRPSNRWDKDASRLNQPRRKGSRSKKARTKSELELQPTSEAYFPTDPIGPMEPDETNPSRRAPSSAAGEPVSEQKSGFPLPAPAEMSAQAEMSKAATQSTLTEHSNRTQTGQPFQAGSNPGPASNGDSASRRDLGSVHSRGSGTANSPISVDDHFGATRRLLFPSPRKDGVPKVLGELAANVVSTTATEQLAGKGINPVNHADVPNQKKRKGAVTDCEQDDMVDLFGTPPQVVRSSTPPPRSTENRMSSGAPPATPYKTPTRTTPMHRPITRSISKSIRCVSNSKSPAQPILLQRTPSKVQGKTPLRTPRSVRNSASRRCMASMTLGHQQAMVPPFLDGMTFDAPFASTLNQLLSEANDFTNGSPSHGLADLDLTSLDNLDSLHDSTAGIDFGSYLDTDLLMPSSSPLLGRKSGGRQQHLTFGGSLAFDASDALWTDFSEANLSLEEAA